MQSIKEFKIDTWVQQHGTKANTKLHGSCASTASVNDLHSMAPSLPSPINSDVKLEYGTAVGSVQLRERIAELHSTPETTLTADNVVITPGSILANYLVLGTICGPGDNVICQYPTFAQLHALPKANGAEVTMWTMREEENWIPSVDELAGLIKPNTKAIILNNPSNPTGTALSADKLEQIMVVAEKHKLIVFSDEVFRPLFYNDGPKPPPFVSLGYPLSLSTGSVSKAHGLPGIRLGWVVTQNKQLLDRIVTVRDYTTTSVSQLDDSVAAFALSKEVLPGLLQRNISLCQESIALIRDFVERNSQTCSWVAPSGGGVAFVRVLGRDGTPVDDKAFCTRLVAEEGVSCTPGGHAFQNEGTEDFKGYIRIGLGQPSQVRIGLQVLEKFLSKFNEA